MVTNRLPIATAEKCCDCGGEMREPRYWQRRRVCRRCAELYLQVEWDQVDESQRRGPGPAIVASLIVWAAVWFVLIFG